MDYLIHYMNELNLDMSKAEKRRLVPTENGTRTAAKEMIGEEIIKRYHLFDWIFPDNLGFKKIKDKKLQLAGVDYEVYTDEGTIYVDLKSCIGPNYNMKREDFDTVEADNDLLSRKGVPIEIYQSNEFTNTKAKLTDYMLYIICDEEGIFYCSLPYQEVRNFSLKHKDQYIINRENGTASLQKHYPFTRYTSNNGTGIYCKDPVFTTKLNQSL